MFENQFRVLGAQISWEINYFFLKSVKYHVGNLERHCSFISKVIYQFIDLLFTFNGVIIFSCISMSFYFPILTFSHFRKQVQLSQMARLMVLIWEFILWVLHFYIRLSFWSISKYFVFNVTVCNDVMVVFQIAQHHSKVAKKGNSRIVILEFPQSH